MMNFTWRDIQNWLAIHNDESYLPRNCDEFDIEGLAALATDPETVIKLIQWEMLLLVAYPEAVRNSTQRNMLHFLLTQKLWWIQPRGTCCAFYSTRSSDEFDPEGQTELFTHLEAVMNSTLKDMLCLLLTRKLWWIRPRGTCCASCRRWVWGLHIRGLNHRRRNWKHPFDSNTTWSQIQSGSLRLILKDWNNRDG